jgi:hypothetical protein
MGKKEAEEIEGGNVEEEEIKNSTASYAATIPAIFSEASLG